MAPREPQEDPLKAPLSARCRKMGLPPTKSNMKAVRAEWCGCEAGKAMAGAVKGHEERAVMWNAIKHMRRVQASFDRAIGAPDRHPKCMSMAAQSGWGVPSDRTDEEIQRTATAELMTLETWLGYTDSAAASEAKRVVIDDVRVRDVVGLVSALRCVVDGIAGRAGVWRGRVDRITDPR